VSSAASTAPICMLTLAPIRRHRDEAPTHHACMSTVSASRLKPLPGAARHRRAPGRPRVRAPVGTHRSVRHPARGGRRETSPGGTPHVDALATRPDPRGRPHRLHTCGRIQPGRDRRAERCRAERCRAKRRRPEHARRVGVAGGVLTPRIVRDRRAGSRRGARRLHAVVTCSHSVVVRAPRGERESDAQPRLGGERTPAGG